MAMSVSCVVHAQQTQGEDGTMYVQSLFKYPEAPDFLDNIQARCDYLMDHFWDDMNFKQKVVNQAALQHAFSVYAAPMQWAQKAKVLNSVNSLIKKLEKNPSLFTQFMKAAEETFHSPRSEVYIDEVYSSFAEAYAKSKKVPENRKQRYRDQLVAMNSTLPGMLAPSLTLVDAHGETVIPRMGANFTIYIFGPSANNDLRQWMLRLNSDMALERLCDSGVLAINVFSTDVNDTSDISGILPPFVPHARVSSGLEKYDLRSVPSVYLLDSEQRIMGRNLTLSDAFEIIGLALRNTTNTKESAQ